MIKHTELLVQLGVTVPELYGFFEKEFCDHCKKFCTFRCMILIHSPGKGCA
jgi:hypothetical protein